VAVICYPTKFNNFDYLIIKKRITHGNFQKEEN